VRQLTGLARNSQTDTEPISDWSADNEAARLDAQYAVDLAKPRFRHLIDHRSQSLGVAKQWRDITKEYTRLRKVRNITD